MQAVSHAPFQNKGSIAMNINKLTGAALATAVAGLFSAAAATSTFAHDGPHATDEAEAEAKIQCAESSACKGYGECKTAKNACKGQNACRGTGITMQKTDADCKAAQAEAKKPT